MYWTQEIFLSYLNYSFCRPLDYAARMAAQLDPQHPPAPNAKPPQTANICHLVLPLHGSQFFAATNGVFVCAWRTVNFMELHR